MFRSLFVVLSFFSILVHNIFSTEVYLTLIKEISLENVPTDIIVYEDYAYILTSTGIISFKPSDPLKINLTEIPIDGGAKSLAFSGRFGFTLGNYDGIKYFDFSKNPPVYKSSIMNNGLLKKLVIDNGYLYVVNNTLGLQVYDINIVDFPVYRNNQILPGDVSGIFIKDKKAYVTGFNATLYIIDISDIIKLPIVGSYNYGMNFLEPYVDGSYAYIPQGNSGVQVIDITKLPFPEWVANIYVRKSAKQVVTSNYYVWIVDGFIIEGYFNIDPKSFIYAGRYENKNSVINKIMVHEGKYIYVLTADKKLKVVKIEYKI
jgi:hypothetical protein